MNRSLRKELRREIINSRNRFLSIFLMVALGVMFLVGLRSAAPDMRATSDSYFDEHQFYDVQIMSTLGLTEEDIAAFSQAEGVETAQGGWSVDATMDWQGTQKVIKALSFSQTMNTPTAVEGRLPETAGECALDEKLLLSLDVAVGDTVTLTPGDSMEGAWETDTFTVTGVVESPLYISLDRGTSTLGDGTVSGFVLLPEDSFTLDYYTVVNIRAAGASELDAYSDAYQEKIDALTDQLETLAEERADLRYDTLVSDAQQELDEAQQELDDAQGKAQQELDEGWAELEDAKQQLEDGQLELEQAKADYEQGKIDGQQELDDARQELDDGWAELEEAKTTLNNSQAELDAQKATGQTQLAAAYQKLADSQTQLEEQRTTLESAQTQLEEQKAQVDAYAAALEQQQAQVEAAEQLGTPIDPESLQFDAETLSQLEEQVAAAQAEIDSGTAALAAGETQLKQGWSDYYTQAASAQAQLDSAQAQIDSGWQDYYDGQAELESGEADYLQGQQDYETQLAEAAQEIADAEEELAQGQQDYEDGLKTWQDGKDEATEKIADGQQEIDDAKAELADITPADVYVLDRESNYGFVSYDQNATRMENLAKMFPLIFFIVAALVCLTTMTRMVEEERTQIGSIKAMGYGTGAIAAKFLLYGVLAALGGSIVGAIIGTILIPWVIFTSYGIMYTLPKLHLEIRWGLCLGAAAAGLACTVGATLWAMLSTARTSPAELMRPKTPRAGKRIFLERIGFLWRRFPFSVKVSARNLFRYKKRFWMTVIGVAGCTGLLIAGLGLRSSIFSIIDIQYGNVYQYDIQSTVDTQTAGVQEQVAELLDGDTQVLSYASVNTRSVTFQSDSGSADGYLTVTDDRAAISQEIDFHTMKSQEPLTIPEDGILIDEKLAELLAVQVGDTITIDCGQRITAQVAGINEHYIYHYAYMTAEQYTALTGNDYEANEFLITTRDAETTQLCRDLMAVEGVRTASNLVATATTFRETLEVVNAAVTIIVLSAAALALVVLYNLTNINITERIRELATIKVLGFYDREVAMYIYRENIVLTVLGIGLGQLLGKFLCTYLIRTIEMDIVMFGREALGKDYLLSIVLSLCFALLVNVMMYFRMKKIDMVQSLKSVE